jgi:hypothetical protein
MTSGAMTENAKAMIDVAALGVALGKFALTPEEKAIQATLTLAECQQVAMQCRLRSRLWMKAAKIYEMLARQR